MTIEEAIRQHLMTKGALTALVGDRIHHLKRIQGDPAPAVVYFSVSRNTLMNLEGGEAGMTNARYQFESSGRTSVQAKAVDEQLRQALSGFAGTMGDLAVHAVLPEDLTDEYDVDPSGSDKGSVVVVRDFMIHWTETIPTP